MDGMESDGNSTSMGEMTMQMYFFASAQVTILFKEWKTMTWPELLGSCLLFIILAFLQEGIRAIRYWLSAKHDRERRSSSRARSTEGAISLDEVKDSVNYGTTARLVEQPQSKSYTSKIHILQTLLHFLQIFNSYCLMLVVMTFNIFLIISICLGASLGYYAFAWREPQQYFDNDCCH